MKLSHADINSDLWGRLSKHLDKRLQELRRDNDSKLLDALSTAHLRGRISSLKELLALAEREPAPEQEASDGE